MAHSHVPFQRYDNEFKSLRAQVQESLVSNNDEEADQTGNLITQCDELLQQMALEARSVADAKLKRELLAQVRVCKGELSSLKDQHKKKELMAPTRGAAGNNGRQSLIQNEDMLHNQQSKLDSAMQSIEETTQVAMEITSELGNNRETIESAHARVRSVGGMTGRARRILTSMGRRQVQQKMIMYGLSGSIVVVFVILVWWMK